MGAVAQDVYSRADARLLGGRLKGGHDDVEVVRKPCVAFYAGNATIFSASTSLRMVSSRSKCSVAGLSRETTRRRCGARGWAGSIGGIGGGGVSKLASGSSSRMSWEPTRRS